MATKYQVGLGEDGTTWSTHRKLSAARKEAAKQCRLGERVAIFKVTDAQIKRGEGGTMYERVRCRW